MKRGILLTVVFVMVCAIKLQAWGLTGHRVIAEIAERNLDEKAKAGVQDLLDNQSLAYWANWGDFIKSDTLDTWKHTGTWHYVNAPSGMSKPDFIEFIKGIKIESVYSEIPKLEALIKNKKASKEERKIALVFLIHLVGDMHQPMHVGREEDLGGNKIKIRWFDEPVNLHSLWDSKLINFEQYSYTEYAAILNVATDDQRRELQSGTLEDWLYDSHKIADDLYASVNAGDNLKFDYNFKTKGIVESQLQKGGLRLARILNELF